MQIQPLNDRIHVRRDKAADKVGLIIIPDTGKQPQLQGEVLAVGTGAILDDGSRRSLEVEVGDTVMFSQHAGTELEVDGEKDLIIAEADVHARVVEGKVLPLNDRLLVRRDEAPEKIGSIIVPERAKEPPLEGEVLAVGTGAILQDGRRRMLDLKSGDQVLFGKYAGADIEVDGETYVIMAEADVHAKVVSND